LIRLPKSLHCCTLEPPSSSSSLSRSASCCAACCSVALPRSLLLLVSSSSWCCLLLVLLLVWLWLLLRLIQGGAGMSTALRQVVPFVSSLLEGSIKVSTRCRYIHCILASASLTGTNPYAHVLVAASVPRWCHHHTGSSGSHSTDRRLATERLVQSSSHWFVSTIELAHRAWIADTTVEQATSNCCLPHSAR